VELFLFDLISGAHIYKLHHLRNPHLLQLSFFFEKSRSFTFIMPQKRNSDANSHLNFPSRAWLTIHNHWRRRADCRFVISGQREVILKHAQKYESVRPNYLSIEDKIRKFLGLLVQQWRRHHGAQMGTDGHVPSTLGNGWARGHRRGSEINGNKYNVKFTQECFSCYKTTET